MVHVGNNDAQSSLSQHNPVIAAEMIRSASAYCCNNSTTVSEGIVSFPIGKLQMPSCSADKRSPEQVSELGSAGT